MEQDHCDVPVHYCSECGEEGGSSLKRCMSCMLVKYCNAKCQRKHWPKHKIDCKQRAAELRNEALFKDPPAKEDCPICFLPMPMGSASCVNLPPATVLSVPVYEFAIANEELAHMGMEDYYSCCGKAICGGCVHSFCDSGTHAKCPFCNTERFGKADAKTVEEMLHRVEANDAGAIYALGSYYSHGQVGLHQDEEKAKELWTQAARLGSSKAHYCLGSIYDRGGDLKKTKFHWEAAAMAGHEDARCCLGNLEYKSGKVEQACKHLAIAASAGDYKSMHALIVFYKKGCVSRGSIDSTLTAYNNSCAEMRSEARDAAIRRFIYRRLVINN